MPSWRTVRHLFGRGEHEPQWLHTKRCFQGTQPQLDRKKSSRRLPDRLLPPNQPVPVPRQLPRVPDQCRPPRRGQLPLLPLLLPPVGVSGDKVRALVYRGAPRGVQAVRGGERVLCETGQGAEAAGGQEGHRDKVLQEFGAAA